MTDSLLPSETLQSQVSAFVDDELPSAETDLFVRRLVKDADLKQTLSRYQLMGEALRAPGVTPQLSRDFSARVAAALEQQHSATPAVAVVRQPIGQWLRPVSGLAIAAGVAWVAVLAVRNQPAEVTSHVQSADALQPVALTAQLMADSRPDSYVVPTASNAPSAPIPATRLTNYVVAHSEFSSPFGRRNVMTGLLAGEQPVPEATPENELASEP